MRRASPSRRREGARRAAALADRRRPPRRGGERAADDAHDVPRSCAAYYLLKTAREVFILSEGGAEVKSYSSAGQALLLLVLVPAYGAFASRVNRVQLVQWVTLFFVANLVLFLLALGAGPAHRHRRTSCGSASSTSMVIAQFWAFANDLYTEEQGKRLFPLIGVGSSLGAWLGSVRAGQLVEAFGPAAAAGRRRRHPGRVRAARALVDRVTRRDASRDGRSRPTRRLPAGPNGFSDDLRPIAICC